MVLFWQWFFRLLSLYRPHSSWCPQYTGQGYHVSTDFNLPSSLGFQFCFERSPMQPKLVWNFWISYCSSQVPRPGAHASLPRSVCFSFFSQSSEVWAPGFLLIPDKGSITELNLYRQLRSIFFFFRGRIIFQMLLHSFKSLKPSTRHTSLVKAPRASCPAGCTIRQYSARSQRISAPCLSCLSSVYQQCLWLHIFKLFFLFILQSFFIGESEHRSPQPQIKLLSFSN